MNRGALEFLDQRLAQGLCAVGFMIVTVLCASASCATPTYFNTRVITDGEYFSFPIFSREKDDKASTRINQFLQLSELYFVSKHPVSAYIFHQAKVNDGSIYGAKFAMSSSIYSNNDRVLSLGFTESSSGATTHYWVQYYTFNSGTGRRIELSDLFTEDGYRKFKDLVFERRSAKYRKEVEKKVEPDEREGFLDLAGSFQYDDLSDYYIQRRSIVIDGSNWLGKGMMFNDLDMTTRFSLSSFKVYLNDYGRAVFGIERANISTFRSEQLPQLFSGTVNGTYPIVMVLGIDYKDDYATSYRGYYAYLRYGEALMVSGDDRKDQIDLTEHILSPTVIHNALGPYRPVQDSGYISGKLSGLSFSGTWTDLTRSKQLSFYASAD
ncbi:MAG: hypothetical protein R2682_14390 [Pyrinomonadaceae bacterium]